MRNLNVIRRYQTRENFPYLFDEACRFSLVENGQLFICDDSNQQFLRFKDVVDFINVEKAEELVSEGSHQIQYVSAMDFLFLAAKDGTFFQTRDPILEVGNFTELFKCEQGVETFAVSPDCRRMAILTKLQTLLLLTLPDLECLIVHELFTSTELKQQEIDNTKSHEGSIVWRNDSRYFAINVPVFSDASCNKREIQIYDEDGSLNAKSQLDDFEILNEVLTWQSSGGLVATFGKSPHGNAIIFLELNGLKRSHLQLSHTKKVRKVSWNSSSDILCVQYTNEVELWTRSNYVWMLKKKLMHRNNSSSTIRFSSWDPDLPGRFHLVYSDYCTIYDLTTCYKSGVSGSALTVSYNGNKLYCTPFRDNSAPPPYGFLQANVDSDIVDVLFNDLWDGFLCITYNGLVLFRLDQNATSLTPIEQVEFSENFPASQVDGWAWPTLSTLCCTCDGILMTSPTDFQQPPSDFSKEPDNILPEKNTIIFSSLKLTEIDHAQLQYLRLMSIKGVTNEVLAEMSNNMLIRINLETKSFNTVLPSPYGFSLSLCTIHHLNLQNNNILIIFLHNPNTRQLFISSSEQKNSTFFEPLRILGEYTSIALFFDNVLLTTLSGSLEILNKDLIMELVKHQSMGGTDASKILETKFHRKVEKGSVIVTCCVNRMLEPSLILQIIPRGNFETICPRPLLVSTIRATLRDESNEVRFEKIMNAVRRHRLDYRVLIDEMRAIETDVPSLTLQNSLKTMVEQVKDSHSLVLLVTDLDEQYEDCIRIIKDLLEQHLSQELEERQTNIEEAYLASLAKLGLLEEALLSRLIQGENKEERNVVTHRVKFLSYYCTNPDILFDTSLGTYDLGLASLVADCLGKDPKEYVPILDELNQLSSFKRKFKIDDKLRRYSKAITYLIRDQSTQHQEVLKYMERHRLFTDVISFINQLLLKPKGSSDNEDDGDVGISESRGSDGLTTLLQESKFSYGSYLAEHTKFREAMILYREADQFDDAIECAIKCGDWENALDLFYSRSSPESDLKTMCERLLDILEERKNYSGAARLCEVYLRDYSRAVGYWIRARKWRRAKSLTHLVDNPEEDTIRPKLVEATTERQEQLTSLTEEISKYFRRWLIVKDIKAKRELEGGGDNLDSFSETDSLSSYSTKSGSSSGKSYRTSSKSKRKHEKKLYSMKEGSTHEDLGITAHLWTIFDKIQDELKPDTSKLITSLWEFNENQLAKDLGTTLDQLLLESGTAVLGIWPSVLLDELIEMKYRIPPPGWATTWDKLVLHDSSFKAIKQ